MNKEVLILFGFLSVFVIPALMILCTLGTSGEDASEFFSKGFIIFIALVILGLILTLVIKLAKHAKDIVIKVGRKTLDICTALDVVLCTIILVVGFFQCSSEYGITAFMWWYVLGAIVVFLATLLANFTLYLLIDIRDSLKKLADKKGE